MSPTAQVPFSHDLARLTLRIAGESAREAPLGEPQRHYMAVGAVTSDAHPSASDAVSDLEDHLLPRVDITRPNRASSPSD
jgi:hypothetical protein